MALLTIFSAPKPFFNPHISIIQRNAIQSWMHLGKEVEVLLIGQEDGLAEVAAAYRVNCLPDVERNENGTPLVSSIFHLARKASQSRLMAYVNADILLLPELVQSARQVSEQVEQFLIVGQRWDLDVRELLDFNPGWGTRLKTDIKKRGRLHLPAGSDYFIFPRELFQEIPNFAIGRAGWDNWMIYHAHQQGWQVVDATASIQVIHQDHDYSHLAGGRPHYDQPESRQNEAMAGGRTNLYMVLDSDKEFSGGRVRTPRPTLLRLLRMGEMRLAPPDGKKKGWRWSLARQFRRTRRRITGSL
jgi:hypothetical protein